MSIQKEAILGAVLAGGASKALYAGRLGSKMVAQGVKTTVPKVGKVVKATAEHLKRNANSYAGAMGSSPILSAVGMDNPKMTAAGVGASLVGKAIQKGRSMRKKAAIMPNFRARAARVGKVVSNKAVGPIVGGAALRRKSDYSIMAAAQEGGRGAKSYKRSIGKPYARPAHKELESRARKFGGDIKPGALSKTAMYLTFLNFQGKED